METVHSSHISEIFKLKNSMCKQQSTTGVLRGCMQKCTVQETTRGCIKSVKIDSKKHYWTETCPPPPCTMHHVTRWLLTLFLYLKVDFLYFYWENVCLGEKSFVFLLLVTITEFIVLFSHWKSFKMKQNAKLAIATHFWRGGGLFTKWGCSTEEFKNHSCRHTSRWFCDSRWEELFDEM